MVPDENSVFKDTKLLYSPDNNRRNTKLEIKYN